MPRNTEPGARSSSSSTGRNAYKACERLYKHGPAHPLLLADRLREERKLVGVLPPPPRIALSVDEVCQSLGLSWDSWRQYVEPHVRLIRLGRRKVIAVSELEAWCERTAERTLE